MSIYASLPGLDDEHPEECDIWVWQSPSGIHFRDTSRTCTCGRPDAPYYYPGSHILPSENDPRGGSVGLALIPGHITRDGRDDQPDDGKPWPWLRLSVDDHTSGEGAAVLITPVQARHLADQLTRWADRAIEQPPAPALTVEELRGGFWPDMTGGLCSVCHIKLNRGAEKPDPGHPECVAAFDTPAAEVVEQQPTSTVPEAGVTVPVPAEVFAALVQVAAHVSVGRGAAFLGRYPDATARRALGALDDAGLLNQPQQPQEADHA